MHTLTTTATSAADTSHVNGLNVFPSLLAAAAAAAADSDDPAEKTCVPSNVVAGNKTETVLSFFLPLFLSHPLASP